MPVLKLTVDRNEILINNSPKGKIIQWGMETEGRVRSGDPSVYGGPLIILTVDLSLSE